MTKMQKPTRKTADQVDEYVGNRLRMRRMMVGITQVQLGTHLGLTFQQIQKYEKGTNRISASRLQLMSQILGVTPDFFFEQIGPEHDNGPVLSHVTAFLSNSHGLALARAFTRLKDRKLRRSIVALAEEIADCLEAKSLGRKT